MPLQHRRLHHNPLRDDAEDAPVVVVKTVFQTLEPTFKGPIGGFVTMREAKEEATSVAPALPTKSVADIEDVVDRAGLAQDTDIPSAIKQPVATKVDSTQLAEATAKVDPTGTLAVAGSDQYTTGGISAPDPTSSDASSASSSAAAGATTGLSTGATAGIVFGALGGILLVGFIVYFAFIRRRKQAEQTQRSRDDEKLHGPMNGSAMAMAGRTDPRAPRISLRPVTQFFPNWNMDKRSSKGAAMALSPTSANNRAPGGSAWERPSTSQSMHPNNPFGNQAERAPSPVVEEHNMYDRSLPPTPANEERSPFDDPMTASGPATTTTSGAGLSRKTSMRKGGPKNLDLTLTAPLGPVPASPAGTEFSMNSEAAGPAPGTAVSGGAAAIAAAGGPANTPVHRVQLDFKPTLEDEMGLKAGDLVRLLHEYDDGWALCIRLDRSQQGVVPRTCLSTRPVKPRAPPGGGRPGPPVNPNRPRGPGQRPMTPQGYGRPESPAGRPMSPAGRPMSPAGRPMSPSGLSRPANGPGPSPMNPRQNQFPGGMPPGQAY